MKILFLIFNLILLVSTQKFPNCQFKSGQAYSGNKDYSKSDFISIWINSPNNGNTDFNIYWHGPMIDECKKINKLPVFYSYIIAFEARQRQGLQDCDVSPTNNLCTRGSQFIKDNRALLVSRYTHWASKIAERLGKNSSAIFLMEPDFW